MSTLMLTSPDVERLVEWDGLVHALERALVELAQGQAVQPTPISLRDPADSASDAPAVIPMAAFSPALGMFAIKVLADAPRNRDLGLPAQRSTVSVYDAQTGECVGVLDGRALTRIRTAAITAIATRALARPEARTLTLLGAGALAIEHAHAISRMFPLDEVRVWSRSDERAAQTAETLWGARVPARALSSLRGALSGADIVCTLTPSESPILFAEDVEPGTHINAVGSPPRPSYSEVAPDVFTRASRVVVDDRGVAAADSGNVRNALAAGAIAVGDLTALGEVLDASAPGRPDQSAVTLYNSVGIGLQDLAAAEFLLRRAAGAGTGTMVTVRD